MNYIIGKLFHKELFKGCQFPIFAGKEENQV